MTREQALALVNEKMSNKNLIKHVLAVEVVMRDLADHFEKSQDKWGLAGLLHDLDYELTADNPEQHSLVTTEWLEKYDLDPAILHAIKCHNNLAERESLMDKAIYAADPVTGLIVAAALMHPDKKLKSIDTDFILRRFKVKSFARGANRDQIKSCQEMDLSLEQFISISLTAMQRIDHELGL
jgi:uncharacterized protein